MNLIAPIYSVLKLFLPGMFVLAGLCAGQSLEAVVERMDRAAQGFQAMSAQIKQLRYTAVINESEEESGSLTLVRHQPGEVRMLAEFGAPNNRAVSFQARKLQIFYPKMNTVQEYNLGKQAALVDQFLLLGFGTPGSVIRQSYEMKYMGEETVGGQKCARLELVPKTAEARGRIPRIETWIAESTGQPAQQKVYQGAKDYTLVVYTNLKLNPPLAADATRLKLPAGVKREYPQR